MTTRRNFLKSAALTGMLGKLPGLAAATGDYKALVCVFLYGGNDSNNMLVPLDAKGYAGYAAVRKTLALPQADLLAIDSAGAALGLHPAMTDFRKLYESKRAAVVANVGNLAKPLTRAQYQSALDADVPANLFSHLDQQQQWQSAATDGFATTGWGGRLADLLAGAGSFPMVTSVAGNAMFIVGSKSSPATVIPGAALGLKGFDTSATAQARRKALERLMTTDGRNEVVAAANAMLEQGVADAARLNQAMAGQPALQTVFPTGSSLATQLQQVAKLIQVRGALSAQRQIFFCSLGGFDTHTNQLSDQNRLLGQVSAALAAFDSAMVELGLGSQVTTFTSSDFTRTYVPNSTGGTDHAWGGHQLVVGGAVKGGLVYGTMPVLEPGGPDDAAREGRWIPTIATDQYGATLASWFGLPEAQLGQVFPVLGNFSTKNVGFLA